MLMVDLSTKRLLLSMQVWLHCLTQALRVDTGNVTSRWLLSNIYVAPGKLQVIDEREMKQVCLGHTWIKVNVKVQMYVVAGGHHAQMIDICAEISGR
jgi:hypothetical protein